MKHSKYIIFSLFLAVLAYGLSGESLNKVVDRMKPYTGIHNPGVDTTTLDGKVMCGYQGWFAAEGDGADRGWFHYAANHEILKPGHCGFDLWPDMSEMDDDEKFATEFKHADGSTAYLFSSYKEKTVKRHFKWMKDYSIDGVFLQRFGVSLRDASGMNQNNVVLRNVQHGANKHGRAWAVMYDLSGLQLGEVESVVMEDWKNLIDKMKIHDDKSYLHHLGKPVVSVWGVGFKGRRKYTLEECDRLVDFLKNDKDYGGNTVMLGLPTNWRTLDGDSRGEKHLHEIVKKADIISPWMVGRYNTPEGARYHGKNRMVHDIKWADNHKKDYLPVIFPGFSWQNLLKVRGKYGDLDAIPRLKGQFLWSQAVSAKNSGANMLYVAMFDEIDEATAIFKCTDNPPVGESNFLAYDVPSDHYLWLTGKTGKMIRGDIKATEEMPARCDKLAEVADNN